MSLTVKNINKAFEDKLIFEDFSYEFREKGIYAITGESGIGKTTLLRIIAGLDKNYRGEVIDGGIKNVSFAFQEYRLFPSVSAIENLLSIGCEKNEAEKILIRLGFSRQDFNLMPSELSGGMKQRVSLARAFLKKSPILLLDEPTKELDSKLKDTLYDLIKKEAENRLIIFVTHNTDDISALSATEIKL